MPEMRRFLRYVIPGLVFVTEALFLIVALDPGWLTILAGALKEAAGLGVVAATLLASGGLGFLFSVAHHAFHWMYPKTALDYTDLVSTLRERRHLIVLDPKTSTPSDSKITRMTAWVIVTSLWNERTGTSEVIKAADAKVMAMTDLVHSTGSAFIASVAAVIAFAIDGALTATPLSAGRTLPTIGAAILIILLHWVSYRRTTVLAHAMIEAVLSDALRIEASKETSKEASKGAIATTYISTSLTIPQDRPKLPVGGP